MQIQPEVIMMKDGRYIYIKTILPDPDNARALVAHTKKVLEETNYLVRYPDEYTIDAEGELRVLDTYLKSIDSFFIGAFDGDRLIGTLDGGPAKTYRRYRHRMEIGMAVQKDYWDNGIGSKLVENALYFAKRLGYEQVNLSVFADNERAVHVYEKLGFKVDGRVIDGFKDLDGTYHDELHMSKEIVWG